MRPSSIGRDIKMKPIGTITVYYPFLDSETRKIMEFIMTEAYNYQSFVKQLSRKVCTEETTELAIFFAVHHSILLYDFNCLDEVARKYGKLSIIRPNLYWANSLQGQYDDWKKAVDAANSVLEENPPDWLEMEMYLLRLEASIQDYPKNIYDVTALDMINYLLESNPKLAFYKSRLFDGLALISRRDGDIETELENLNAGIENAKNFDDLHRLAHLLRTKAGMIQSTDRTAALELLRESQKLMEVLGDDSGLADVLFHISKLTAIRGEFNKAIEYLLDCVRINESLGAPQGIFALMLSTYYNIIGNPNAGFEWAKLAETESRPTIIPRAILNQAWSATLQREYDTASEIIDSTREAILKSGLESNLGWLYFISGVLEMHLGRYDDAAGSLENAIDIYERRGGLMSMLICSLYRARLEIVLMNDVDSDLSDEEELPWIYLMEEKTRVDDMPGFLGLVLLLKLEVTRLMNKEETPLAIAAEIWTIARDYDLSFLQEALDRVNPI